MKLANLILIILLIAYPIDTFAQSDDKPSENKHGTYLKVDLAHWQEDIFGKNSLTEWKGNLFGSDYNLTSAGFDIETYFQNSHVGLSGWSVGYRKDDLRYMDSGHMFNGKVFGSLNLKIFELKPSVGMEWGMPSATFDKTRFDYGQNGAVSYQHTYPIKNAGVPFVGTKRDGAFYPFAELSVVERPGPFILEAGMRVNVIRFGIDDYSIKSDKITYDFKSRELPVPYLFASVGIKMF